MGRFRHFLQKLSLILDLIREFRLIQSNLRIYKRFPRDLDHFRRLDSLCLQCRLLNREQRGNGGCELHPTNNLLLYLRVLELLRLQKFVLAHILLALCNFLVDWAFWYKQLKGLVVR